MPEAVAAQLLAAEPPRDHDDTIRRLLDELHGTRLDDEHRDRACQINSLTVGALEAEVAVETVATAQSGEIMG